jgi:AGCS family alanine or glycine:cation symporter
MDIINEVINSLNLLLWNYILIASLLVVGIYFTFRTGFAQIRYLKHSFSILSSQKQEKHKHHVSSFEVLSTSMASVVGVGSIAGMSIAIHLGGPGSIFWVWVISLMGMSTSLVEHTLGQVYKRKSGDGMFIGGPAYYIWSGLKNKPLAYVFSAVVLIVYGLIFNSVQANTIGASFQHAFNIDAKITALALVVFSALIIYGGLRRIIKVSSILVPVMGAFYLIITFTVIILNIKEVPAIFLLIIKSAFGIKEVTAGIVSYGFLQAVVVGVKRALFSTEAGMGSTPNITASAYVKHPVRQGLVGMLGVFFVAFIICTSTAILVLSTDAYKSSDLQGIQIAQASLGVFLGDFAVYALSLAIFIFGFTSIIGNYSYAEHNLDFLKGNLIHRHILRIIFLLTVYFGTLASLNTVWNLADVFMGIMILINLYALVKLSDIAIRTIKHYKKELKDGKIPEFKKSIVKQLSKDENNVW